MFLHVRLKVRDTARSVAFYTRFFGARVEEQKRSPRGTELTFLSFSEGSTQLELAHLPWDPDFKLDEDIFHLAFEVLDMGVALQELRLGGVKITEEATRLGGGGYMAFIEDPDGYEIELLSQR